MFSRATTSTSIRAPARAFHTVQAANFHSAVSRSSSSLQLSTSRRAAASSVAATAAPTPLLLSRPTVHQSFHRHMSTSFTTPSVTPLTLVPGVTRLGWIGTGVMGASMAGHLQKLGYPLTVYNRTKAKTKGLEEAGAKVADTVEEVAANSDVVFSIVAYPHDVRAVYLGGNGRKGVLDVLKPGSIVVDMTTSEPALAAEIHQAAAAKGIASLDAPVSGGDIGAREARLSIMVGGDKEAVDAINPLLLAMGPNITHCGAAGAGQHTKMVNQILIASTMVGVVEGLLYAHKAGLDPLTTIKAVQAGAAGSFSITNLGPKIVARNFEPGFYVDHFLKDLKIALDEANRMGLALPGLALARQLYVSTQALGAGQNATTALTLALEAMNGMDLSKK